MIAPLAQVGGERPEHPRAEHDGANPRDGHDNRKTADARFHKGGKCITNVARILTLGLVCGFLFAAPSYATTYYVRTDGSNSNLGTSNTAGGAWLTIDFASDNVAAGDTIRVQEGTYAESVSPSDAGTDGNPITFVADGAVTFCTLVLSNGDNYLRFIGFTIDTDAGSCVKQPRAVAMTGTQTGIEFWNNTIRDATGGGISHSNITDVHDKFVVIGNTFTALGNPMGATSVTLRGSNNIIAYNDFTTIANDAFGMHTLSSRYLNNYVAGTVGNASFHSDFWQGVSSELGIQDNLFEGNFYVGAGTYGDEHIMQIRNLSPAQCVGGTGSCGDINENMWRYNVYHNGNGGWAFFDPDEGPIANTRIVHETVVEMLRFATTQANVMNFTDTDVNGFVHNNLFWEAWGTGISTNINPFLVSGGAVMTSANYNLAHDPDGSVTFHADWSAQANEQSNIDPLLVDVDGDDFHLQAGSPAIGAAGPLATTSGSGTGTTFNVVAGGGGFFRGANANISQYSGALAPGDVITVGTDAVTVVSIATDAITVTPSFTWADAESVYLGTDTTPDIGAYPYKAGGYTLSATYTTNGGAITVNPNDDSLVRFVICYDDSVPYAVDNTTPYTCSTPSGTLTARVYPRYAGTTLSVVATLSPDAAAISGASRLRRRRGH